MMNCRKNAEEVETEILEEARSQRKRVPVISHLTKAEAGLNGMSRSEIEGTVWAIAQAEIIEMIWMPGYRLYVCTEAVQGMGYINKILMWMW